jgi:hypothetical protein
MVSCQRRQCLQAFAARRCAPGGLLVEQRVRLCEQVARRFDPEAQLIEQRQRMICPVSDENRRALQVHLQGGQHGQPHRAR